MLKAMLATDINTEYITGDNLIPVWKLTDGTSISVFLVGFSFLTDFT